MCFAKVLSISNQSKTLHSALHTHTNKDWINKQPLDRTDSVNDVF